MAYDIRAFIGIWPDETIRRKIRDLTGKNKVLNGISWVPHDNFHLTLKFLGQIPMDTLPKLFRILEKTSEALPPLTLTMKGALAFPNPDQPRVLCYGFENDIESQDLTKMAETFDTELEKIDFPKERRPFKAHATIARIRDYQNPGVMDAVESFMETDRKVRGLIWPVDEICLIRSELRPSRATYEVMASYPLLGDSEIDYSTDDDWNSE
ncbi:MAG: RNA 2',3'-cyclic phosphodiesterase [Candidatus Wallbacteria bacterium HGW-Wallbacteria-1]|jgi:2'-5' RNA ligase|uniref:RNA 2',3'-cyclic phosphodiesterase n=1 Tax=Candidatus Wallbacteria bacterium HGW-Wallbacteria-1 TaxID=2013854 RepID=A0A2N1PRY5_9BACT|nr:MAG: RNA 2',3'-cyclic phosphodiesterase [Candidatus Wallbacteria bacterium HGW-Wallbacteria-1]